jgi:hypothetical protein
MRGGSARRYSIADSLAEQLGIEEPLGLVGMGVLLKHVPELEQVPSRRPRRLAVGRRPAGPGRVVRAATTDLDETGLVVALRELGWSRLSSPVTLHDVADVRDALSRAHTERLTSGILRSPISGATVGSGGRTPRRPPPARSS